jgi:hypothetical protein
MRAGITGVQEHLGFYTSPANGSALNAAENLAMLCSQTGKVVGDKELYLNAQYGLETTFWTFKSTV